MPSERRLHDGRHDGLVPLESFDLSQIQTFAELLRAMGKTAFGGRQVGEAFDILLEMIGRRECQVVLTVSGAMTVAKQGQLICELIDRGLVQAIVATGALIAHGLTESIGLTHYRYDNSKSDETLFEQGYNRIYDTLEMEANLNDVESLIRSVMNESQPQDGVWSSARLCRAIGARLIQLDQGRGILRSAAERSVPVFIPAFTDSEIGLDVATWAMLSAFQGQASPATAADVFTTVPNFNPFLDLQEYARFVAQHRRNRHPYDWWWRTPQLGTAGLALLRCREFATRHKLGTASIQVRRSHLSRTRSLGRPIRLYLFRRCQLGQIRRSGPRRTLR